MEKNSLHNKHEFYLAKWFAGEITDAEFRNYVSEGDFDAYKKLQNGIGVYEEIEGPQRDTFALIQKKIQLRKTHRKPLHIGLKWAVGVAASIVLFLGLYQGFGNSVTLEQTTFAEQKTIVLLDGSEVVLNSKSEIRYTKKDWEQSRTLFLEGEAFFKVKKGSTFTVNTANGTIRVLGTQFNVNTNSDFFEVYCHEGKVRVETQQDHNVLIQGDLIRRINGNPIKRSNAFEMPTWLSGESSFKSVPLAYVIDALERQYGLTFDTTAIDGSAVFTGSFGHENLEVALASVFKTMRIHYIKKDTNVFVLSHNL